MIVPFPIERARARDARIAGHLMAAAYCQGKARLMASYGDECAADFFARQGLEHMACVPQGEVIPLTIL